MSEISAAQIRNLFPKAVAWMGAVEADILARGVALKGRSEEIARRIGIAEIGRARLLCVKEMPVPEDAVLRRVAAHAGLIAELTAGTTFRYGIAIRADCWGDEALLAHELTYVLQYERLGGGIEAFLEAYIQETLFPPGYPLGPLEVEAEETARRVLAEMG